MLRDLCRHYCKKITIHVSTSNQFLAFNTFIAILILHLIHSLLVMVRLLGSKALSTPPCLKLLHLRMYICTDTNRNSLEEVIAAEQEGKLTPFKKS